MDKGSDIKLDPDITEDGCHSQIPLSDLYKFPVFSADSEQKIREYHIQEEKRLGQICQNIFRTDGQEREKDELKQLQSRIFQEANVSVAPEVIDKANETPGIWTKVQMTAIVCITAFLIVYCTVHFQPNNAE